MAIKRDEQDGSVYVMLSATNPFTLVRGFLGELEQAAIFKNLLAEMMQVVVLVGLSTLF
ncbi:hypothetical protein [Legionella bozemanae]|uniref:hypothetical protein n=1 Tax=Legionella bozemanae TaxID=447 RepID=UPI000E16177B|nr:hypothetical protein [Legionella bozemanae]STP14032.1 Uncharacterised protein [Legionella bozemanae]